jgi:hypothetical protein
VTDVVTDELLFPVFRSTGPVEVTVAVFVTEPAVGVTVIVNVALEPEARLASVQVTVPDELTHPAEAEENVSLAGRWSVTAMPVAVLGPALLTVSV